MADERRYPTKRQVTSLKEEVAGVKDLETFGAFESDTSKSAIVASGGLCIVWPW